MKRLGILAFPVAVILAAPMAHACEPGSPEIGVIVRAQGEVLVDGRPFELTGSRITVCAGQTVSVGMNSRATLYSRLSDTTFVIDQHSRARFSAGGPSVDGGFDLLDGVLYFLSAVRQRLDFATPYVSGGVEGTEVLIRLVRSQAFTGTELTVLEGVVTLDEPATLTPLSTGERLRIDAAGQGIERRVLTPGQPLDALALAVGSDIAWTLHYPDVLVGQRAARYPAIVRAAELARVGRSEAAQAILLPIDGTIDGDEERAGLAFALRTIVALVQNRGAKARLLAERAVALAPRSPASWLVRSLTGQAEGDLDQALLDAARADELAPSDPAVLARLSELALMQGDTRRAVRLARDARAADGGILALIALGFAQLAAFDARAAATIFESILDVQSGNPDAWAGLGLARFRLGDPQEGLAMLETAAGLDPGRSWLRSYLGRAYALNARADKATAQFEIARALDPLDPTPWYFEALARQGANEPAVALADMQEAIARNDQRASFRSRLMLARDEAGRNVDLARILNDLGFDTKAVLTASRAVSEDHRGFAGHRFLAEAFATRPRHEIVATSEHLQASLLQPPSRTPLLPRLDYSDLSLSAVPAALGAGYNDYTGLFDREGFGARASGFVGNQGSFGQEASLAAHHGRHAIAAGQLYSTSDGFRDNADTRYSLQSVFYQAELRPGIGLQGEIRRRRSDRGDLAQRFDEDDFTTNTEDHLDQDTFRVGGRVDLAPGSTLVASGLHTEIDEPSRVDGTRVDEEHSKGWQGELKHILKRPGFAAITGLGGYTVDVRDIAIEPEGRQAALDLDSTARTDFTRSSLNLYNYTTLNLRPGLSLTAGLAYDDYEERNTEIDRISPKFGLSFEPGDRVRLRAAYFETIRRALPVEQTLEPTQIAGFAQFFDDTNGTKAKTLGLGIDLELGQGLFAGLEFRRRKLDKIFEFTNFSRSYEQEEDRLSGYLAWVLSERFSLSIEPAIDRFEGEETPAPFIPDTVWTYELPVNLRFLDKSGLFAQLGGTFVHQDVDWHNDRPFFANRQGGDESFIVIDAGIGYRLPERQGSVRLEATNLFDQDFRYLDDNYRSNKQRLGRFVPDASVLLRATLQW